MPSLSGKPDIAELLKRHSDFNCKTPSGIKYSVWEILDVLWLARRKLSKEPTLLEVKAPVVIVGDIHGQYGDLQRIFRMFSSKNKSGQCTQRYLFLGDYVDRGRSSLEVIMCLLVHKLAYPDKFHLIRGNHETKHINCTFGFLDELESRFDKPTAFDLWEAFNDTFALLPLAALVHKKILCMHGGVGPDLKSLDDIKNIKRPLDDPGINALASDLLWADPMLNSSGYAVNTFRKLNIDLIVRAHQMMRNGYGFFCNRKLVTIFSAPNYICQSSNSGAVMKIDRQLRAGFVILHTVKRDQIGLKHFKEEFSKRNNDRSYTSRDRKPDPGASNSAEALTLSTKKALFEAFAPPPPQFITNSFFSRRPPPLTVMLRLLPLLFVIWVGLNPTEAILFVQRNAARDFHSLDGLWTFVREPRNSHAIGFAEKWYERDLRHFKNATVMPVPAAYNDLTADVNVRDHVGWVWYQTHYTQSSLISKDVRSFIRFSSVNYQAAVFVNGVFIGYHTGGHLPFEFDVKLSSQQPNSITVAVNNTLSHSTIPPGEFQYKTGEMYPKGFFVQTPGFDFFNYAGILRSVYVVYTGLSYIKDIKIVADAENKSVTYDVSGNICSTCKVSGTILDPNDKPVSLHSGRSGKVELDQHEIRLWWPRGYGDQPLYTLRVTILKDGEVVDLYDEQFGFRTVSWTSDHLLINGKPFYCLGFGMHEDFELHGRGYDPVVMTKDFNMLEWMGGNCYRTSHYPYSEERAREADRRGIVVITETPAVGMKVFNAENQKLHAKMLQEMISRDKNHPSVVMWSISNEPWTDRKEARQYYKDLIDIAHLVDPTRPVTIVYGPTGFSNDVTPDLVDIICVNRYYGWYSNMGYLQTVNTSLIYDITQWKRKFKRPIIITEYGADSIPGLYQEPSMDFSEQYQVDLMRETHIAFDQLRKKNILAGEMIWNFADFMTAQDVKRAVGNHKGVLTRTRQPKRAAYVLKQRYGAMRNKT
ncbi:hypothetical protein QR680_008144 [Steinernema hermaphroditum]|uniref:Serine/threonine-protein phosphatase n=1 Tax=Steinernema hermaphroditum TaxID=289476 RepID=A0AA39IGZ5_9BILA|nr:hypothetical protein QR680_008144 [Steinernema hermaphroditum]